MSTGTPDSQVESPSSTDAIQAPPQRGLIRSMIKLARPLDWVKSLFILAPVPFALADRSVDAHFEPLVFLAGLFGFCFLSSSIYILNDIWDAEADRLHPKKRFRPIASGRVPVWLASIESLLLVSTAMALFSYCTLHGRLVVLILGLIYLLTNCLYCLGAKHLTLLDVFLISSGFVIRVLVGCALVAVTPSEWLLFCSGTLALFLAFAKRRADLVAGMDAQHRPSLAGYSVSFLDQALAISAGIALLSYALYSREAEVFAEGRKLATIPFAAYAVLDYLRLAQVEGTGGSPIDVLKRSIGLQVCCVGWVLTVLWSLKLWI
ncbi:Decaprenyl-phosphate phosphoribosyltransferase [Planctomycetales bacterium 10988]|nr:Decaprenyl-phosphate phosphoribosyltransferase [Planctomycetales bacterium 10988]